MLTGKSTVVQSYPVVRVVGRRHFLTVDFDQESGIPTDDRTNNVDNFLGAWSLILPNLRPIFLCKTNKNIEKKDLQHGSFFFLSYSFQQFKEHSGQPTLSLFIPLTVLS